MKKTLEERIDAFVKELKEAYPENVKEEGVSDAWVILGVQRDEDGGLAHIGYSYGNDMSITAALLALFKNERMVELLKMDTEFSIKEKAEELKRMLADGEEEAN